MKPLIFISLCILLFWSCESSERKKQIDKLTAMIEVTDSLNRIFEKNKMDSAVEYQLAANTCMLRLKNNYKPNKVDMVLGEKVNEFKKLQRLFKKKHNHKTLSDEANVISNSIREEKQALYNLKMDIEGGNGNQEKYNEFITFEQGKVNTIKVLLEQYVIRKNKYLPRFRKSVKELNDFMDKWEKENMSKK
jgi:hypothetical protein